MAKMVTVLPTSWSQGTRPAVTFALSHAKIKSRPRSSVSTGPSHTTPKPAGKRLAGQEIGCVNSNFKDADGNGFDILKNDFSCAYEEDF